MSEDCPALFQFDVDGKEQGGMFKVDVVRGELEPGAHGYVTVVFDPKECGVFVRQLVCLVLNCVSRSFWALL